MQGWSTPRDTDAAGQTQGYRVCPYPETWMLPVRFRDAGSIHTQRHRCLQFGLQPGHGNFNKLLQGFNMQQGLRPLWLNPKYILRARGMGVDASILNTTNCSPNLLYILNTTNCSMTLLYILNTTNRSTNFLYKFQNKNSPLIPKTEVRRLDGSWEQSSLMCVYMCACMCAVCLFSWNLRGDFFVVVVLEPWMQPHNAHEDGKESTSHLYWNCRGGAWGT